MTPVEIVASLRARGVTVVADGDLLRCRPKSALTEEDLALLRNRKPEILAFLRPAISDSPPVTCFNCRSRRFWKSVHGAVVCGVCHPPAFPNLVAAWVEADERVRATERRGDRVAPVVLRVEPLPSATPQDIAKVEKLLSTFGATIVASGPDDTTDGAA